MLHLVGLSTHFNMMRGTYSVKLSYLVNHLVEGKLGD